jgi:hypothetical protein
MPNRALKLAVALSIMLALATPSFAGGFARHAGYAGRGSMPIPSGLIHSDDSQIVRSSSSSRDESRNYHRRHAIGPSPT